ncbi:MAG: DUF2752 domain-containing protein [Clostridia bacterium]|nr:DUF2752 domain-containing protein [Clostridia bacterium]
MGVRRIKSIIPIVISIALLILIAVFSDTGLCVFRRITGLPCPSCGMTRAYVELLSGNVAGAFLMHPLFWFIPIIIGLMIHTQATGKSHTKAYVVIGVIFLVVYIIRMILLFPHTYPFDYEHSSILGRLLFPK